MADGAYNATEFLGRVGKHGTLVSVTRAAENRVFYRQSPPPSATRQGHPCWYGERFNLKDDTTWGSPDETAETTFITKRGRTYRVCLQGWHHLLKRGQRDLPMHHYPFTLIRAVVLDEHGQPVFKRALWLVVLGERRGELSLVESWQAYGQRTTWKPLMIAKVNTWHLRPDAWTAIPNLFLAADYIRTYTQLATMEAANEAARRAVNSIISASGANVPLCRLWQIHEPDILGLWRWYDQRRYDRGQPWVSEFPWFINALQRVIIGLLRLMRR